MTLHTIYGKCSEQNGVITLEANRDAPDGIGCALCFVEWDGSPLRLQTERVEVWREEPWADLWFVARHMGDESKVYYPMRYARFAGDAWEVGLIPTKEAQDQIILATWANGPHLQRQDVYSVSWSSDALHIKPHGHFGTYSLGAPVCELGLYCEGCKMEVRLTGTGSVSAPRLPCASPEGV